MGKSSSKKKGGNKSERDLAKQKTQSLPETIDVIKEYPIQGVTDTQDDNATKSKKFALKFAFLKDKLKVDAYTEQGATHLSRDKIRARLPYFSIMC
jgi:hypothetical protein